MLRVLYVMSSDALFEKKLADVFRAILNTLFFGTVVLCGAGWAGKSLAG